MEKQDLRVWLSLTTADLLGWAAFLLVIAMYIVQHDTTDGLLAAAALCLAAGACAMGVRADPRFSARTNVLKRLLYPAFVVVIVVAVLFHFIWWQPTMRQLAEPHRPPTAAGK